MRYLNKVHKDILPHAQQLLWKELRSTPDDFVLYGGTALALRFGHRVSVDFDFFSNHEFDPERLYAKIPYLKGSTVQQMAPNTLTCSVTRGEPVQVSFFGGLPLGRVGEPELAHENSLCIASPLDIGAAKVRVVIARPAWKDYVDVDVLIQHGIPLIKMLSAASSLYEAPYSPMLSLKALSYFEDLGAELPQDTRNRLSKAVESVDLHALKLMPINKKIAPERSLGLGV